MWTAVGRHSRIVLMRPKKHCHISKHPKIRFFKPQGKFIENQIVHLTDSELESLRLKNIADLDQGEGAIKMGVSQSTYQRILTGAYKKITLALTEGRAISISEEKETKIDCWECQKFSGSDPEMICSPCSDDRRNNA